MSIGLRGARTSSCKLDVGAPVTLTIDGFRMQLTGVVARRDAEAALIKLQLDDDQKADLDGWLSTDVSPKGRVGPERSWPAAPAIGLRDSDARVSRLTCVKPVPVA